MSFNGFCPTATNKILWWSRCQTRCQTSALDLGAGPGAGPKNFEILKFDELTDFDVFSDVNGVDIKYD